MSSKFEGIKELRRRNYNVVVNTLKVRRTTLMQELDFLEGVINSFDFDYMSDTKQEELINKNK